MHPNDAELVRAFTREKGTLIGDITFPVTDDFEIVVEARAGSTIHALGAHYETRIFLRDLTANVDISIDPLAGYTGNMMDSNWPTLPVQFVYTVQVGDLIGKENHICQVYAFLKVGMIHANVSLAVSPLFMLTS